MACVRCRWAGERRCCCCRCRRLLLLHRAARYSYESHLLSCRMVGFSALPPHSITAVAAFVGIGVIVNGAIAKWKSEIAAKRTCLLVGLCVVFWVQGTRHCNISRCGRDACVDTAVDTVLPTCGYDVLCMRHAVMRAASTVNCIITGAHAHAHNSLGDSNGTQGAKLGGGGCGYSWSDEIYRRWTTELAKNRCAIAFIAFTKCNTNSELWTHYIVRRIEWAAVYQSIG